MMVIDTNETKLDTIAQRQGFLKATPEVRFGGVGEEDGTEIYEHISRVLKRFDDPPPQMGRARRGARLLAAHQWLQPSPDKTSGGALAQKPARCEAHC